MNLERVNIGLDPNRVCSTGILGIKDDRGNFRAVSKTRGTWDFYYFKYVHTFDNVEDLLDELSILNLLGVLAPENEISIEDFLVMAKLQTLVPPREFKRFP